MVPERLRRHFKALAVPRRARCWNHRRNNGALTTTQKSWRWSTEFLIGGLHARVCRYGPGHFPVAFSDNDRRGGRESSRDKSLRYATWAFQEIMVTPQIGSLC